MEDKKEEKSGFSYVYSAEEQAELRRIREKYTSPAETPDKMERLRRLDAAVTGTAQAVALVFGVLGTLILGFGMSLCMTDLGVNLGLEGITPFVVGVSVGIVGGVLASLAYPVYSAVLRAKRRRVAPEIIRLTDELME